VARELEYVLVAHLDGLDHHRRGVPLERIPNTFPRPLARKIPCVVNGHRRRQF
jgi:hypothetical protein